jgi:hypothetical protein
MEKAIPLRCGLIGALISLAFAPAGAAVYGSLANFDVVNDTGEIAHGFEIDINDPTYDHTKLQSIFGLDRNFGVPPASVERYGAPTITDIAGVGVKIVYQAQFAAGAWSVGTPTGPYANPGDSCWPFGNPLYNSGTLTCDHFGVSTYNNPAQVVYNWLLDPTNSGILMPVVNAIPAVQFLPQAAANPVPGQPEPLPVVVAEIEAHVEAGHLYGTPYWVKVYANHVDHNVELDNLVHHNADVPNDNQVEAEWEIFQAGDKNAQKLANIGLNAGDKALVVRYEFYKYQGNLLNGEALCGGGKGGGGGGGGGGKGGGGGGGGAAITPADCGGLGAYVGAQIAGFNAVVLPPLAVPEPGVGTLLLSGLGLVATLGRRRATKR